MFRKSREWFATKQWFSLPVKEDWTFLQDSISFPQASERTIFWGFFSPEDLFLQVLLFCLIHFLKPHANITTDTSDSQSNLVEVRQTKSKSDGRGRTWTQILHVCISFLPNRNELKVVSRKRV